MMPGMQNSQQTQQSQSQQPQSQSQSQSQGQGMQMPSQMRGMQGGMPSGFASLAGMAGMGAPSQGQGQSQGQVRMSQ